MQTNGLSVGHLQRYYLPTPLDISFNHLNSNRLNHILDNRLHCNDQIQSRSIPIHAHNFGIRHHTSFYSWLPIVSCRIYSLAISIYRMSISHAMPSEWVPCTVCGKLMDPGQIPRICQACCGDDNWD